MPIPFLKKNYETIRGRKIPYYITGMSEAHNFIKHGMHPGIANGVCA